MNKPSDTVQAGTQEGTGEYEYVGSPRHGPNDKYSQMSVHELKEWLTKHGADLTGVVEKDELVELARKMSSS